MNSLLFFAEIIGTIGFAASGALLAIKKDFDILGIVIMGIIASVGGGVIRDIILGAAPPVMFSNPVYCITAAIISLLICIPDVRRFLYRKDIYAITMVLMDSIGLSVFTVTGIMYSARMYPGNHLLLFFTGVITGVGGGVIRDILACEKPYIFTKHVYASASIIGAVMCVYLREVMPESIAALTGASATLVIRLLSARFRLKLPHVKNNDDV